MAQDSWPSPAHNSRNVTDPEYERIAARFSDNGILGSPADSSVVFTTTGLQVFVRAGKVGSLRGHAWTSGTTDVTLSIGANSSGQTRIDRVVLRLDRATWDVRAVVKAGTPGSGAPVLTQDAFDTGMYEIPLARVTVPNAATSVTVQREELYVGSRIRPVRSTETNPIAMPGDIEYETDTERWRGFNGSDRVTIYEDTGFITLGAPFSSWKLVGANSGRRIGSQVWLRVSVERQGSTLSASDPDGSKIGSVPTELRPSSYNFFAAKFSPTGGPARVEVRPDGEIWVNHNEQNIVVGRQLQLTMNYLQV